MKLLRDRLSKFAYRLSFLLCVLSLILVLYSYGTAANVNYGLTTRGQGGLLTRRIIGSRASCGVLDFRYAELLPNLMQGSWRYAEGWSSWADLYPYRETPKKIIWSTMGFSYCDVQMPVLGYMESPIIDFRVLSFPIWLIAALCFLHSACWLVQRLRQRRPTLPPTAPLPPPSSSL